jgi:hypothetical protein
MRDGVSLRSVQKQWKHPLTRLSCEVEGHPLGGGVLKLEPGEAACVAFPGMNQVFGSRDLEALVEGVDIMRQWRHYENSCT